MSTLSGVSTGHRAMESVLLVERINDSCARKLLIEAARHFHDEFHLQVYVESYVLHEITDIDFFLEFSESCKVDFVMAFGGDGTILHVARLCPCECPPVIPIAMGSLGFLTTFQPNDWKHIGEKVIKGLYQVTQRMRIIAEIHCQNGVVESVQAMNEIALVPKLCAEVASISCLIDDEYLTTVYGDGLIIGTSTGSTAYTLSAGAPLLNPSIPALVWCPICAHSLNAHPLVLPDSVKLKLSIANNGRRQCPYQLLCDGKPRELGNYDHVVIFASPYKFPTVCLEQPTIDWLVAISTKLEWNVPVKHVVTSYEERELPLDC